MRAELKRLHSPDVDELAEFSPEQQTEFCVLIQAMVGPLGDKSEESFDVVVCSPSWIARRANEVAVFSPRHHLVMTRFDYEALRSYISEFCVSCEGANWEEVGTKVSRLGHWEFEDYS